jgi:hypothetical protein
VGIGQHHRLIGQPPGLVLGALMYRLGFAQRNFNLAGPTLMPTPARQIPSYRSSLHSEL